MKSILALCAALLLASGTSACSVYMEATRPTPTDLNAFQVGMTRDQVVEKLGAPDTTAVAFDGLSCDFYKLYTRGYGAGGKVPIAIAEGAADFFTIGLAEIVLTPTEGVTKNQKHPVQFCYQGQQLARVTTDTPPNEAASSTPAITAASDGASTGQSITSPAPTSNSESAPAPSVAPTSPTTPE
jgi:outer membrane protein assembly factor BamE (lipoprotein component of BamABCDE complex)